MHAKVTFKKFFFLTVLFFILSLIFCVLFLTPVIFDKLITAEEKLIKYQLNKIKNNKFNTIFLGDSSLGNFIDAQEWSLMSNQQTANLALFGETSFYGAYKILLKTDLSKLENIYIVSSFDVWKRNKSSLDPFSMINKNLIFKINKSLNSRDFRHIIKYYLNLLSYNLGLNNNFLYVQNNLKNDYIQQDINYKPVKKIPINYFFTINSNKFYYLDKINKICNENKINCMYINGVIYEEFCKLKSFNKLTDDLEKLFFQKKINYANNKTCVTYEKIGDSYDHLHPKLKKKYTKKIYKFIQNLK